MSAIFNIGSNNKRPARCRRRRVCFVWLLFAVSIAVSSALLVNCVRRSSNPLYNKSVAMPLADLKAKGDSYLKRDMADSALIQYMVIHNRYWPDMSLQDKRLVTGAFNNAGYIYFYYLNDYVQAYAMLLRSLDVADELDSDGCKAETYLNIGNIYANYDDENTSVYMYRKALEVAVRTRRYKTMYIALCNMLTRTQCVDIVPGKDIGEALPELAILDTVHTGPMPLQATCRELATAYRSAYAGDYRSALDKLQTAADVVDAERTPERFRINIIMQIAYLQSRHGENDRAVATVRRAVSQSRQSGAIDLEGICYVNMAQYFFKLGLKDSADYYKLKGYEVNDSLVNMRKLTAIKDMERSNQMRAANMEIHDLVSDKRLQLYVILILSGAGVIILGLLIWILVKHRRLRQSHEALYNQIQRAIEPVVIVPADGEACQPVAEAKYAGSPLDEAGKQAIYAAIEKVMEDTALICADDFSLDRLAAIIDVKARHISQVLTEEGTSFNTIRNDFRIREACRRLADRQTYGNYTIEAIARDLGFKSRTHFSALFKKTTGLTPGEYVKLSRKNRRKF